MTRVCLHCVLHRALEAERQAFAARGLDPRLGKTDAVFLPLRASEVYRGLRTLLRAAHARAERAPVKLAVLAAVGKSHVEVIATVLRGRKSEVLSCAFPLTDVASLSGGFAEHA
ncbi:MAG TPA: hypothetical protein VFD84_17710 [Candidatus Binatia bacterium]|jgi:hypothetical protein|nr:hypothetical protein [Candidatus Binatia bacterium]